MGTKVFWHIILLFGFLPTGVALGQTLSSELKFQSESFISPYYESSSSNNFQFLRLNIRNAEPEKEAFQMDVKGLFSFNSSLLNSLNVGQLYYQNVSTDQRTSLLIGRKMWNWSDLDRRWDLGIWEPVFKWNPLSPENQGLTGLFWVVENQSLRLMLFASPIFLPTQGPQFEMNEQGQFTEANPWYRTPPKSVKLFSSNDSADIEYRIQKPTESQVVIHSTYAGQVQFGAEEGVKASLAYAYKPMNQLLLAYDGIFNVAKNKAEVDVLPFVQYHSLTSADLSYQVGRLRTGVSGLKDSPQNNSNLESHWTKPVLSTATSVSPYIDIDGGMFGGSIAYIQVQGGDIAEVGSLANPDRMTLNSTYRFKEATDLGLRMRYRMAKNKYLVSQIHWTQSAKNQFELIKWSNMMKFARSWNVFGEVQLVKAEEQSLLNRNEVAEYANNDRIMIGAGYVF